MGVGDPNWNSFGNNVPLAIPGSIDMRYNARRGRGRAVQTKRECWPVIAGFKTFNPCGRSDSRVAPQLRSLPPCPPSVNDFFPF